MEHLGFQGVNLHPALLLSLHHQEPGYPSRPGEDSVTSQDANPWNSSRLTYGQRDASLLTLTSAFPQKGAIYAF